MKPAALDYLRVESMAQAIDALRDVGEDARILAGGQSLMAVLNMRLSQPRLLIDINAAKDLQTIDLDTDHLVVRAAVTQARVEWRDDLEHTVPLLGLTFPSISHFQIRNRGTVCGSVAHADPSAELPLVLSALGGDVCLHSTRGARTVAASDFFAGMLMTAREPDELIEAVRFPLHQAGCGYGFAECAVRHGDFAIVAVAAVARPDRLTIAVGGVADRPVVTDWPHYGLHAHPEIEAMPQETLRAEINDLSWRLGARDDGQISAAYRRHLVRTLTHQAVIAAFSDSRRRVSHNKEAA